MRVISIVFIIIITCLSGRAQKVAVVMSGGAAKGLAHIGMLKALEENEIPVDYVAGTSMGGIVAGCYAAGMSPTQIENIMLTEDLNRWITGQLEEGYNFYYYKDDIEPSFIRLNLLLDSTFNLNLNASIANDISLNFAIAEKMAQPSAIARGNFDSLFVPLRVMASEIFTQKEIVLKGGSLGDALRATQTVPFFYTPIRIDGQYLFDGGVYNNFPVDVAEQEFKPDIIIGCNVSSKIYEEYPYKDDDKLLSRSLLYLLMDKSNPTRVPASGIYLQPELKGISGFDFAKVKAIIDSGYVETIRRMPEIKAKIAARRTCDEVAALRNKFNNKTVPLLVDSVLVREHTTNQQRYISRMFKRGKRPLNFTDVKRGYYRLVSEDYFKNLYPSFIYDSTSHHFDFTLSKRPLNNFQVDFGGVIATRNISNIFGISIIFIYTLAGTLFAVLLGAEGLNALATHWAPNLFVFATFIVFALSFFGLFEITAPYQLVNKADQQAEKGGLIGIFFMAATLVLVSFSCTLPIVGNVVVLAAGGQIIKPVLAMFFYSLAFSIPFTLFAIFPEWIKGMPKSGGWLNSVKVTLGFLELALCLKFFSIADQAYHWGLLDRDLNIALWVVIFGLLGFYILGKLPMKGDSAVEHLSVPRLLIATAIFSFVVYLIPGLWGAPLKSLAGYLPPLYTHDFNLAEEQNAGVTTGCEPPKYSEFLHLPHGLSGYFDYKQALACARQQKKPLFIDFTGHGCTNCREMEAVVWSDQKVLNILKNEFVVVALYVDDKTLLPETDWYVSAHDNKEKKTLGKQNADLQITNLENNAQPFYVLVGADERVLAWPYGYNRSPESFVAFLERGKAKYRSLYP